MFRESQLTRGGKDKIKRLDEKRGLPNNRPGSDRYGMAVISRSLRWQSPLECFGCEVSDQMDTDAAWSITNRALDPRTYILLNADFDKNASR